MRILETTLYVRDLDEAEAFYKEVLGLEMVSRFNDGLVFRCDGGVLLLFEGEATRSAMRGVPPHGADGSGHVAFAVGADDLGAWRRRLARHHVEIEAQADWPAGRSLYFRDPAGNLLELAPPKLWGFDPGNSDAPA